MSFLYSKRLHWGTHHEVMENLKLHIDDAVQQNHQPSPAGAAPLDYEDAGQTENEKRAAHNKSLDDLFGP